jgi:hypothetical protein
VQPHLAAQTVRGADLTEADARPACHYCAC